MTARILLLALLACAACRSRAPAPSAEPAPSVVAKALPSVSAAMGAAPKSPLHVASTPPPVSMDSTSQAALARARKLQAVGELERAKAEFLRAAGAGQALHLQPLVELGYLQLMHFGESDEEAESLLLAGTASDDPVLEAQAWFNLATLFERRGEAEAQRAALSRSLARRENQSARSKLGGRSTCVAEVGKRNAHSTPTTVAGWPGVCVQLQLCPSSDVPSAEARRSACLESSYSAAEPDRSHGCPGPGPWQTTFGYSWFSYQSGWIAAVGGERFFVDLARVGSWPATCRGSVTPDWKQEAGYAVVTLEDDEVRPLPGRPIPQADPENGVCITGGRTTTTAVYRADSAELLAAVSVSNRHPVRVRFDAAEKKLVLEGGGCDGFVAADGAFRAVTGE